MIKCRKCKDMMLEALYGELGVDEKRMLDEHLRACPDCASEYSVLGATLRVMDKRQRPDPGPAFWDGYYDRLRQRMEKEASASPASQVAEPSTRSSLKAFMTRLLSPLPRWSYQAAAAVALVAVGILIGRALLSPPTPVTIAGDQPAADTTGLIPASDAAAIRAQNYLERSKLLLLGIVNYDPQTDDPYGLDMPLRKEISRELVSEAADIRGSLNAPGQTRLRDLIADLELILLQIANLESEQDLDAVEMVKTGIEQKGIFLKIDLSQMARNARGDTLKPGASGSSGLPPKSLIRF